MQIELEGNQTGMLEATAPVRDCSGLDSGGGRVEIRGVGSFENGLRVQLTKFCYLLTVGENMSLPRFQKLRLVLCFPFSARTTLSCSVTHCFPVHFSSPCDVESKRLLTDSPWSVFTSYLSLRLLFISSSYCRC